MRRRQRGYLLAASAYVTWGFFPLYFRLLRPATAVEILAHRVLWSAVFITLLIAALRGWRSIAALTLSPAVLLGVASAAVLITVNWGTYVYAVNAGQVVEASLGYFVNPLVTVVLGVVVLAERLRPAQWVAVALGGLAVLVLTVDHGQPPWIALVLAFTFGGYALVKKRLGLPAVPGLFIESLAMVLPAVGFLAWLALVGQGTFGRASAGHTALLLLAGAVTAIPLLCFADAANRIPLTAIGLMQYVTPLMQFGFGVLLFREPMPPVRLAGFGLVWLALLVFSVDRLAPRADERRTAPAVPSFGASHRGGRSARSVEDVAEGLGGRAEPSPDHLSRCHQL